MKRITAFTLWIAAAVAPAAWAQHAPTPREALLVLSKGNRTLAIVDPETLKVVATMPSGEDPHEVTCDDRGNVAYITNYGTGRGGYNTLTVADLGRRSRSPPLTWVRCAARTASGSRRARCTSPPKSTR